MAAKRKDPQRRSRHQARPADEEPDSLSIWREALWGLDWLSLRLSPVYLGLGLPRGDGSPVVLVPGFLSTDAYLAEMYFWLRRIGYSPSLSGIGVNADCLRALAKRLEKTVEAACADTGRPVRLIGHSLGGFLARRVALERPDIVGQLISLGSPIQAFEAHPLLMAAARLVETAVDHVGHEAPVLPAGWPAPEWESPVHPTGKCECFTEPVEVRCPPPSVHHAAVHSRDDGLIPWRNCLEPEPELNYEVGGTHIGLVFNPQVYRLVASLLSQASANRRQAA